MRIIGSEMLNKLNTRLGTEPLFVLQIDWGGTIGTRHYGTKAGSFGEFTIPDARILNIGTIDFSAKAGSQGTVGSCSIVLDDFDGTVTSVVNSTRDQKISATLYQLFTGLSSTDSVVLIHGKIVSPLNWDDSNRVVSFQIETDVEGLEVGFSPREDDIEGLDEDAINVTWPLVFGTPAHVPAVRIKRQRRGSLKSPIHLTSPVVTVTGLNAIDLETTTTVKSSYYTEESPGVFTPTDLTNIFYVEGGWKFPQNEEVKIIIDGVIFRGTFEDDKFTVAEANVPEIVTIGPRVGLIPEEVASTSILFLTDETSIVNKHCYSDHWGYNFCVKQEHDKCWFRFPFRALKGIGPEVLPNSGTFEAVTVQKGGMKIAPERGFNAIKAFLENKAPDILRPNAKKFGFLEKIFTSIVTNSNAFVDIEAGRTVRLVGPDPDVYVANSIPSEYVRSVYTERTILEKDGSQKKVFVPVPKSYFDIELEYEVEGYGNCTAILVHTPLEDYQNQGWDTELFVTLKSTVGPNPISIINWLTTNFTNLVPSGSNGSVMSKLANYPANFALLQTQSAMSLIDDIAFQSRCSTLVDGDSLAVRYLSETPAPLMTFTSANVFEKSGKALLSEIDEMATVYEGQWRETYAPEPSRRIRRKFPKRGGFPEYGRERYWTWRENEESFGDIVKEQNFTIYNSQSLVAKSVRFWGHRFANAWKKVSFTTTIKGLILQPFDPVTINIQLLTNVPTALGVVEAVRYSPEQYGVEVLVWLPMISGSGIADGDAWMSDAGDVYPDNISNEFGLVDYDSQLPNESDIV